MIGHQDLSALGDDQVGSGHTLIGDALQLVYQLLDVQCNAVSDDIGDMRVENTGRQNVQRKAAIIVDDGVACVGTALEADDNIGVLRQHIGDLALAFVAPVGADDRFYHSSSS